MGNCGHDRPKRILGKTCPNRKPGKETCIKHAYRNRKWDTRNTGSWNSRWKKTKENAGECKKNVMLHEQKEMNMKNEVSEIGNSGKSEV